LSAGRRTRWRASSIAIAANRASASSCTLAVGLAISARSSGWNRQDVSSLPPHHAAFACSTASGALFQRRLLRFNSRRWPPRERADTPEVILDLGECVKSILNQAFSPSAKSHPFRASWLSFWFNEYRSSWRLSSFEPARRKLPAAAAVWAFASLTKGYLRRLRHAPALARDVPVVRSAHPYRDRFPALAGN
jgi:hypothetical protein